MSVAGLALPYRSRGDGSYTLLQRRTRWRAICGWRRGVKMTVHSGQFAKQRLRLKMWFQVQSLGKTGWHLCCSADWYVAKSTAVYY